MTTTACAAALGITQPAWNQWELGVREPKLDMLSKIARLLDVKVDWLLGLDERGKSAAQVKTGDNSAVAIGANARATVRGTFAARGESAAHPSSDRLRGSLRSGDTGDAPMCAKCPFKKAAKNFQKIFAK